VAIPVEIVFDSLEDIMKPFKPKIEKKRDNLNSKMRVMDDRIALTNPLFPILSALRPLYRIALKRFFFLMRLRYPKPSSNFPKVDTEQLYIHGKIIIE
jgi:hypothetical protein